MRLVDTPDVAQSVRGLAAGGPQPQGLPQRRQDVGRARGGPAQGAERASDGLIVPRGAQCREALALVGLDLRVDAQRLVGFVSVGVDDITERAGLGRTTFFRHYRSKEDVIFPDHDRLLGQVAERLRTSSHGTVLAAVSDAVRLVLLHYVGEGDLARRRYALTSKVPALRDREIASVARYQRLFREFIASWMADTVPADTGEPAPLRAELMASAVVAAHNHVLRRWLRGDSLDPAREVDEALRLVISLFTGSAANADGTGTTIVAFRTGQDIDLLIPALRDLAGEPPAT